ncbi:MAG: hypothetical protein WBA46_09725, partial [Thermomicrobiales bacterium]
MSQTSKATAAATTTRQLWRRRALQSTLALAIGGTSLFGTAVMAQDGSGGATPIPTPAASCTIPDLASVKPVATTTATATLPATVAATATTTTTSTT